VRSCFYLVDGGASDPVGALANNRHSNSPVSSSPGCRAGARRVRPEHPFCRQVLDILPSAQGTASP